MVSLPETIKGISNIRFEKPLHAFQIEYLKSEAHAFQIEDLKSEALDCNPSGYHDCNPSGYHARAKPLILCEAQAWFPLEKQSRALPLHARKKKKRLIVSDCFPKGNKRETKEG